MTCIVGIETSDGVLIGGDSAGVAGYDMITRADEKVFRNGPAIFGFTTSFRMGQILRYTLTVPEPVDRDIDRYMATTFIDACRQAMKDGGYAKVTDSREEGGAFLVGIHKTLYQVGSDFQIGRSRDHFASVGCGSDLALGSLYSTKHTEIPRERLRMALTAAEHFSAGVTRPFKYVAGAWL